MDAHLVSPNPWMILPFVSLLATIALAPLFFPNWWGKHYAKVAVGLALLPLGYYLLGHQAYQRVLHVGHDYLSFIVLIGSLFVVSGGIHINVKGEATPLVNVMYLAIGAILANLLGTTGASMLLIRPWIRMNKYRITAHHIVFFIFIVSNIAGCLTPVGDPPLFLGYLKGIPFWWVTENCWPMWLVAVGLLLAVFYVIDLRNYRRAPKEVRARVAEPDDQWRFEGLWNLAYLGVILGAVFINRPVFVREAIMLAAAAGSYFTTARGVHEANHFNFHPIREVAILFIGIFATMMPALDWLQLNAAKVFDPSPAVFYWASGTLSSVLDNAPTYLSFLSATFGLFVDPQVAAQIHQLVLHHPDLATTTQSEPVRKTIEALMKYYPGALAGRTVSVEQVQVAMLLGHPNLEKYLVAISVGAVFFGACTYIGNGPNFMVKSIADHQRVPTPGFLNYVIHYTLPILLPILALVWWLFFRG